MRRKVALGVAFGAQRHDKSVLLRQMPPRSLENVVPMDKSVSAAQKTATGHADHLSNSNDSSCGVAVSMSSALQSCTARSIKRDICAVS